MAGTGILNAARAICPMAMRALCTQDADQPVPSLFQLRRTDLPGAVNNNVRVGGEQPVGTDAAALVGDPRSRSQRPRVVRSSGPLAPDWAKNQIIALQGSEDQCRPASGLAEIREGEVEDDNVAAYKLAQAASSSGESQSFANEDSAANGGTEEPACSSDSVCRKASRRLRSCSERRSSFWAMSSRLLMSWSTSYLTVSGSRQIQVCRKFES